VDTNAMPVPPVSKTLWSAVALMSFGEVMTTPAAPSMDVVPAVLMSFASLWAVTTTSLV
jgi:hypothetical protein